MPYEVIDETPNGQKVETPQQGMRQAIKEIKQMPQGRMVSGVIGKVKEKQPDTAEVLTDIEKIEKEDIIAVLNKIITPNKLSARSTPESDRLSFIRKLKLMSLKDLQKFLPEGYKVEANKPIPDTVATEIIYKYKDISP